MRYCQYTYAAPLVPGCCTFLVPFFQFVYKAISGRETAIISYINRVIPLGTGDDGSIHETEIGETTSGRRTLFPRFYNMFRGFVRA